MPRIRLYSSDDELPAQDQTGPMSHAERQRAYRQSHRDYVQREQQSRADSRASTRVLKSFASVDGEGAPGRADRSYVLVRAGEHVLVEEPGSGGLRCDECLDWFCHLPADKEYVAFAFDYDVSTILCGYAAYDRGWRALTRLTEHAIDKPVLFHNGNVGWYVWYRPKMEFKVAPARRCPNKPSGWCSTTKTQTKDGKPSKVCGWCGLPADTSRGHMTRISDTIKLFQSTLMKTIVDWQVGTAEERELVQLGKDQRELVHFTDPDERAEVTEYNRLETKLHAEIMERFRDAWMNAAHTPHGNCDGHGLPLPRNWQSPGSLAKILYNHYRVPRRNEVDAADTVPAEVWGIAALAMYGGWFEVSIFGPAPGVFGPAYSLAAGYLPTIPRRITEYDLTSAYPSAMTHLPCLRHSHWEHREPRQGEYGLQQVSALYTRPVRVYLQENDKSSYDTEILCPDTRIDQNYPTFMGLPHRDGHGRVSRPLHTDGWYWNFEVSQAKHQEVTVKDSWTWVADGCGCDMWAFVPQLFALRQRLGKLRGKPVKLAINSLYGVMAERQRGDSEPPYANLIVASFVTAWTRAHIMRTIHENSCDNGLRCGSNVVMIATDAVFFAGDPKLPGAIDSSQKERAQLGDWTRDVFKEGLFIVQGGIYWPPGASEAMSKTRGVPVSILHEHIADFEAAYKRMAKTYNMNDGDVTLRYRRGPDGERTEAKRFIGLREAIFRNERHLLGKFVPFTRRLGFDWTSKRVPLKVKSGGPLWTLPKSAQDPESQPYLPVSLYGGIVPPEMGDQAKLDMLNDSPDWLSVLSSTTEDDDFAATWENME
jgi:hypothetical protein